MNLSDACMQKLAVTHNGRQSSSSAVGLAHLLEDFGELYRGVGWQSIRLFTLGLVSNYSELFMFISESVSKWLLNRKMLSSSLHEAPSLGHKL